MTDIAYSYFNQLDTLEVPELEILSQKINTLISNKKKDDDLSIENELFFLTV